MGRGGSSGFFESDVPATMHRCHNLLHAVKKSTREVSTLGRERVLPWYKGDGREMEKIEFSGVHRVIWTYTKVVSYVRCS